MPTKAGRSQIPQVISSMHDPDEPPLVAISPNIAQPKLKDFVCPLCGARFARCRDMEKHLRRTHMEAESAACAVCDQTLSSASALKRHMLLHTGGATPFACAHCDSAYRQRCELERHLESCHGHRELAGRPREFQCNDCGAAFLTASGRAQHRTRSHPRRRLACPDCPEAAFASAGDLRRHWLARHTPRDQRPYTCPACPRRFCRREHRDKHAAVHAAPWRHQCPRCPGQFISEANLRAHAARCPAVGQASPDSTLIVCVTLGE